MVTWDRAMRCAAALGLVGCPSPAEGGGATDTDGSSSGTSDSSGVTVSSGSSASTASGSAGSSSNGTTTEEPTTSATSTASASSDSSGSEETTGSGCGTDVLEPGKHEGLVLEFDGVDRTYDLLVPASYDASMPTTLVLNFHGYLIGNPTQQAEWSQMDGFAEDAGVVVAYPAGVNASWNGGECCGDAMSGDIDDVGFVRALVEQIAGMLCIDPSRVFATGMSNGGFLSHRLACEAGDLVAAIAPVAGVLGVDTASCEGRAVPVMHFHGTSDLIVAYDGGIFPSVADTMSFWVDHNGCGAEPEVTFQMGDTTCETWSGCTDGADVVLCTITGGGHCWPGNTACPVMSSTDQIHASEAALQFFADHPMP
jgi:polyhydroxybutyrate depolymerase